MRSTIQLLLLCVAGCTSVAGVPVEDAGASITDAQIMDTGTPEVDTGAAQDHVSRFAQMITGYFDSADQAAVDPQYHPVSLDICAIEMPTLGEHVLYVEQAIIGGAPYRQRLYVVRDGGESLDARSFVYELATEALEQRLVGGCDDSSAIMLEVDDVVIREGCEVSVSAMDERFEGGTGERSCWSSLNGASYATSEVVVTADEFRSWDRGFDMDGAQVWGAVAGPYVFVRKDRP